MDPTARIPRHPTRLNRTLFTLAALLVYRLGTSIPLPGLDPDLLVRSYASPAWGGAAIVRLSLLAVGIVPFVGAGFVVLLGAVVVPTRDRSAEGRASRRRRLAWFCRGLTLLIASMSSVGIAARLQEFAAEPGPFFLFATSITLTAGAMLAMWLSEQITSRGLGNGILMIVATGLAAHAPTTIGGFSR